ncbi:hypothetical protein ACTJMV_06335, partial [Enterobacter hormaechei]
MATTPTNLPVPSESPFDFKFNIGKIDEVVTSLQREYEDRFGNKHYTIEGIRWVAQQVMAAFGYITLDSFEDGNTLTLPNQILRLEATGEYYRWDGSFPKVVPANSTPESTGGIGTGKWLSVGDASLRAALAATGGVDLVNGAAKQTDVDKLYDRTDVYAYIEDFANLVVADDWSDAIQAAFDTGKEVKGIKGKQCKVTKIINTKGQKISGEFIINTTRYSLGNVLASSETQVS